MIILLEGADCTGKTTLAETFMAVCGRGCVYYHNTNETNDTSQFASQLRKAKDSSDQGKVVVIDRQWISEQIYGSIVRDKVKDMEGVMMRMNHGFKVLTIMCVRQDKTKHLYHFNSLSREEYARDQQEKIIHAYHDLWYGNSDSSLPWQVGFMARQCPLNMVRSYFRYDMDARDPGRFVDHFLKERA